MTEIAQLSAKMDMVLSALADVAQSVRANEKPMTRVAFAKRIGRSRNTVAGYIAEGRIKTKGGRIPPAELKKFGL